MCSKAEERRLRRERAPALQKRSGGTDNSPALKITKPAGQTDLPVYAYVVVILHLLSVPFLQHGQDIFLIAEARGAAHLPAILQHRQGWDAVDPETACQLRILVHIHLDHPHVAALSGDLLHLGRNHPAGAAPGGPEIQQDGLFAA